MSRNHQEAAEEFANSAETALVNAGDADQVTLIAELQKATAGALMAIYHQLKAIEATRSRCEAQQTWRTPSEHTRELWLELSAEMDHLAKRLPECALNG